jgi:site-specific DNA recombinase
LFEVVLVNDVDRLARDVSHLGVIKRDLLRHGVTILFRKLPNDNSPTNNLLINILGSFAEFERELIADRTRRGRRYKVETRQLFIGCVPPYGYHYVLRRHSVDGEGRLEVVASEASVVRAMYSWVDSEGLSARQVVARLNQRQILPRRRKRAWGRSSVLRILRSETYAGIWHYNKHELRHASETNFTPGARARTTLHRRPRAAWIPVRLPDELRLVDSDQWERVQRQLDANKTFSPRNSKHNYLLRGLLRCGGCSAAYVGDPGHGRFSYRCWARCGKQPTIREQQLNELVWRSVLGVVLNPRLITARLETLLERRRQRVDRSRLQPTDTTRTVARLGAEEDKVIAADRGVEI